MCIVVVSQLTKRDRSCSNWKEFLFYEIGDWEGATAQDKDWVHFFVWNTPLDLLGFDAAFDASNPNEYYEGYSLGLSWKRIAVSNATDLGSGSKTDQIHKITVNIPNTYFQDGQLRLGFLVSMTSGKENESAGVDDFRITAYGIACDLEFEPKPATDVKIDPIELPLICEEKVAVVWGDPHIESFDGLQFDCQGEGEFVLAKSKDEMMQIQGRFKKPKSDKQASVMKALAVKEKGAAPVQVTLGDYKDGKCSLELLVMGLKIDPVSGYLSDNLIVEDLDGDALVMYFPYTRLQLVAVYHYSPNFGCYLSAKICVPDDYKEVIGLLGSADGNPNNEWMSSTGITITATPDMNLHQEIAYKYCTTTWCVTSKANSIFSHTQATFDAVNKCTAAYLGGTQETCVSNPSSTILGVCGDDKPCIVDSCAGDIADGKASLDISYSLFDERGCGYSMLNQDFQGVVTGWGAIGQDTISGQRFRMFNPNNKQLAFSLGGVPGVADRLTIEFLYYALADFATLCPKYPTVCAPNYLSVALGIPNDTSGVATKSFRLDMFGTPNLPMSGYVSGIKWRRNALTTQVHRVEIQIPKKYFHSEFSFAIIANFGHTLFAVGIDDFKLTAHANKCKDMNLFVYKNSARRLGGYGARFTSNDPVLMSDDTIKHALLRHLQEEQQTIILDVESDECACVCPALTTGETGSNSTAPRVMNLYIGHTGDDCAPAGARIGTVTMSVNWNGTATVTYAVDAGYTISQISIYAGGESLPGLGDQKILPVAEFPVTDSPRVGTVTGSYVVDLITCDYYLAAYAKVCGDFPPTERPTPAPILTLLPTGTPTGLPTATPTGTPTSPPTGTPTSSPSGLPTRNPTSSPTTLSPTVASGHPSTSPTTASPTTGTPTSTPTGTPTGSPTGSPTGTPTGLPTATPTGTPTSSPSGLPTRNPTSSPTTLSPTVASGHPSTAPTTASPTTGTPTSTPTGTPTGSPTGAPTGTSTPVASPVASPVAVATPGAAPVATPAATPAAIPVATPVATPGVTPVASPVASPVVIPTPTGSPRGMPTPGKPTPAAPTPGSFGDPVSIGRCIIPVPTVCSFLPLTTFLSLLKAYHGVERNTI
jgi:von Willebrand factor type D domain